MNRHGKRGENRRAGDPLRLERGRAEQALGLVVNGVQVNADGRERLRVEPIEQALSSTPAHRAQDAFLDMGHRDAVAADHRPDRPPARDQREEQVLTADPVLTRCAGPLLGIADEFAGAG